MSWVATAVAAVGGVSSMVGSNKQKQDAKGMAAERMRARNIPFWGNGDKPMKDLMTALPGMYQGGPTDSIPTADKMKARLGDVLDGSISGSNAAGLRSAPSMGANKTALAIGAKSFNTKEGIALNQFAAGLKLKQQEAQEAFLRWQQTGDIEDLKWAQELNDRAQASIAAALGQLGQSVGEAWGSREESGVEGRSDPNDPLAGVLAGGT